MTASTATPPPASLTHYRSGAVARMLRMPVTTLRVWERRYHLTQVALTASGQRLYSADDVRRLALVKQLVDLGHAIGRLAGLDMAALQAVAATHAQALVTSQAGPPTQGPQPAAADVTTQAWRLGLVGPALAGRLRRPALLRLLGRPLELAGPWDTPEAAAQAVAGGTCAPVDAWLLHLPALPPGPAPEAVMAQCATLPGPPALPRAVLFRYAPEPVCEALAAADLALLREPQPDAVLAQWLRSVADRARPAPAPGLPVPETTPSPRRWSDAALADFAGLSSTIACECPRHVAELLSQLSSFEAYSAECESRSREDADLHAHLRDVAAHCRTRFEQALERLALHEGLILPAEPAD